MNPMDKKLYQGLTDAEVAARVAEGRVNKSRASNVRTTGQIIRAHTLTYFNILNVILLLLVISTGRWKHTLFFGVVIANTLIGIIQELRVKQLVDKLTVITAPNARVFRNGRLSDIPIARIVADDIIRIFPGTQIVTDGVVLLTDGLEVNESMLTGESRPVVKKAGDRILSGSFVVAGTGAYRATEVGDDTYAAELARKAKSRRRASSEMQQTIGKIIKVVSVLIIPLGLLLFQSQWISSGGNRADALVYTVSGVIGMIPEGLVLLTSVSFILGVGRLARKQALVQEMESIEALARTDVLCTDKTGTITTGALHVADVIPFAGLDAAIVKDILSEINAAFDDENPTQRALNEYFGKETGWQVREAIPFSSSRKFRAVSFAGRGDYVLGAPEFLAVGNDKLLNLLTDYAKEGYRVLLLGRSDGIDAETRSAGNVKPIAVILLADELKTDAAETFSFFAGNGVTLKVLSGDNPVTVATIAKKAGIPESERYLDASSLPEDPEEFRNAIEGYHIFGRVLPEQKQKFVRAWQEEGHTVAMVGDGVNDVLAIKDADCGIAMAEGAEAAKSAAHIVLLDSDFSSMKNIVREGREIISNIERVSSLYLTKTIYSLMLVLIYILLHKSYPFTTLQMGLINGACIGIPSILLTLEQQENLHHQGFLKHVLKVAAPGALTMVSMMLLVQFFSEVFDWSPEVYSTFTLVLGGFIGLLIVAQVCSPLTYYHKIIVGICSLFFILGILFLPGFYDIHNLWMWWSLLLIPLALLTAMLIYWYSRLTNRFVKFWYREKE